MKVVRERRHFESQMSYNMSKMQDGNNDTQDITR
jgi:hypothetical protein